jgi:hypothetical protein
MSNGAVAAAHLNGNCTWRNRSKQIRKRRYLGKLKVLLTIASKIQQGGKQITGKDVVHARSKGATNKEIHDTVLTAPPSRWTTAAWTDLRRGLLPIPKYTGKTHRASPTTVMEFLPRGPWAHGRRRASREVVKLRVVRCLRTHDTSANDSVHPAAAIGKSDRRPILRFLLTETPTDTRRRCGRRHSLRSAESGDCYHSLHAPQRNLFKAMGSPGEIERGCTILIDRRSANSSLSQVARNGSLVLYRYTDISIVAYRGADRISDTPGHFDSSAPPICRSFLCNGRWRGDSTA